MKKVFMYIKKSYIILCIQENVIYLIKSAGEAEKGSQAGLKEHVCGYHE